MDNRVLLVNPPAEVPRECYDTPNYPAIGIAYIASYLKRHDIPVEVIDGKLARMTVQETIEAIIRGKPRILGLTSMTHMIVTTHKIATAVKKACPDVTIVLGGFHGTFMPERTLKEFPAFDYVCVGEGEIAFHKFTTRVFEGGDPSDIPGIASRTADGIRLNGRGEIPKDLDELGTPAWELFPPAEMYPVMSQRGCPFSCHFCSRPYGRKLRTRSPQHVVDEIKRNYEVYNCTQIDFYDETFTVRKDYVKALCDAIESNGLANKLRLWAYVHANTIDLPTAQAMKRVGFKEVGMGVESGSPRIMKEMGKGVNRNDILRAANVFKQAKLKFGAYFIIGHPYETVAEVKDSINLASEINPDSVAFGIMTPYPGSKLWDLVTNGQSGYKMLTTTWEDFNKQTGKAIELETMSRRTMERLQLQAYLTVYLRNHRFGEMFQAIKINYKRIITICKKILLPSHDDRSSSSSWFEGSSKPQIVTDTPPT